MSIVRGNTGTLTVSGGNQPYTARCDKPSITTSVSGTTVTVTTTNSSAASGKIIITDADHETISVNVTTTES